MTKKKIRETKDVTYDITYGISLRRLKDFIDECIVNYGENASLYISYERYYGDSVYVTAKISYDREETDQEYVARLDKLEKEKIRKKEAAKKKKEEERALYEKLKKQFEKDG